MRNNYFKALVRVFLLILLGSQLTNAQTIYTFTNCSATGGLGPTQAMANAAYASTNLNGQVTVTAGIQYWQVPSSGIYTIEAVGAQGGGTNGGKGARMIGEFTLTAGQVLKILVGQEGTELTSGRFDWSGGGGTFVTDISNNPLIVAGGGGGAAQAGAAADGTTATSGVNGGGGYSLGVGGTAGQGGTWVNQTTDGGAGLIGNGGSGNPSPAPQSFINGGQGGCNSWSTAGCANGGFGGGGGTNRFSTTFYATGGGGGYSGGGAAYGNATQQPFAGGGGSINNGANQVNTGGYGTGHGEVIITRPSTAPNDAGVSAVLSPNSDCVGTYTVTAQIYNAGTNQINNVSVNWSINGALQAPYAHATPLDTAGGTGPNSAVVNLGNITLAAATSYNIKAWTLNPNGVNDTVNSNDTALKSIVGYAYPTINLGPDVFICPEDSATFNAGTGRDSLEWSNTATTQMITVNAPGLYYVSVFENGCESRDSVMLSHHPAAPAVDFGPDTIICYGTTLLLDATAPGVTYLWQDLSTGPTFTVDTAGTYSVNIVDGNGCENGDVIKVTLFKEPSVTMFVAPGNTLCYGKNAKFTAFGKSEGSIMYQWKINGADLGPVTTTNQFDSTTLAHGDTVSVDLITDICATSPYPVPSNKIGMTINPEPKNINGSKTVLENTTEVYVVPLVTTSNYLWTAVGGTISGSQTSNTVTVNWAGQNPNASLTCEETDNGNCTYPNEVAINVVSIIGIDESKNVGMGNPYPNPARTTITIPVYSKVNSDIELALYDIAGKKVRSIHSGSISGNKQFTVYVDDLEEGLYFCRITTADGYDMVQKISILH